MGVDKRVIFSESEYMVVRENNMSNEVLNLLKKTYWGSSGLKYSHGGEGMKVKVLKGKFVYTLYHTGVFIGCAVFSKRKIFNQGKSNLAYYIRYFTIDGQYKGKGLMKKYSQIVLDHLYEEVEDGALIYNLIEVDNKASLSVAKKAGFTPLRTIKVIGFSRFFPKKNKKVFDVCPCDDVEYKLLLGEYFKDQNFVHFDNLFNDQPYFVLRNKGEILAGVQVTPSNWEIKKMPGLLGFVLKHIVPVVPWVNKIVHPKAFKFLAIESCYVPKGNEKLFLELLSSVCEKLGYHSVLGFFDKEDSLYLRLKKKGGLGILDRFTESSAHLMGKVKGEDPGVLQKLSESVAYVSAFDTV